VDRINDEGQMDNAVDCLIFPEINERMIPDIMLSKYKLVSLNFRFDNICT